MAKINIQTSSKYDAATSFQKIKDFLENDADLKKMDPSYKCIFDQANLSGNAKGKLFSADMKILPQQENCQVELEIKLSLMASPFKGMVENALTKKMAKALG